MFMYMLNTEVWYGVAQNGNPRFFPANCRDVYGQLTKKAQYVMKPSYKFDLKIHTINIPDLVVFNSKKYPIYIFRHCLQYTVNFCTGQY